MKKRNMVFIAAVGLVAAALLQSGCETESASTADVWIDPNYTEVYRLDSVTLSAAGWDDFQWSLSDTSIGKLNRTTGLTVVYTAIDSGSGQTTDVDQTITATANVPVSTNSVKNLAATAVVRHVARPTAGGTNLGTVSVSPPNAVAQAGGAAVRLTGTGGQTYQWTLSDTTIGNLSGGNGATVSYTANSSAVVGSQTVYMTALIDGANVGSATATITHVP